MSIFGSRFTEDQSLPEGEHQAVMLSMNWKDTKAGDPMLVVEFRTDSGRTGTARFPQNAKFFVNEAKRACSVLLGVSEPKDFETFFKLVDKRSGRSRFTLKVQNYQNPNGETKTNLLVREPMKEKPKAEDLEEIF